MVHLDPAVQHQIPTMVVGVAGIASTYFISRASMRESEKERDHQRTLARDNRIFDRRALAYVDLMDTLQRWKNNIAATIPTPNEALGDSAVADRSADEMLAIAARLAAFGSAEVQGLAADYEETMRTFYHTASEYAVVMRTGDLADNKGKWEELDSIRQELRVSFSEIQARVKIELQS